MKNIFLLLVGGLSLMAKIAKGDAPCVPVSKMGQFSGYVTGDGESGTFADAKAGAVADALATFGIAISAESTTNEGNTAESVYTTRSIKAEVNRIAKGFEVLSHCSDNASHKVTAGVKKSLMAALIEEHSEHRLTWIKSALIALQGTPAPRVVDSYKKSWAEVQSDEKDDLDTWIVLARPKEFFKMLPSDKREALERRLSTVTQASSKDLAIRSAGDAISTGTLAMVIQRLSGDGITATETHGTDQKSVLWSCSVTRGVAMGKGMRFKARCVLIGQGVQLEPITVNGMGDSDTLNDQAIRLVSDNLLAH